MMEMSGIIFTTDLNFFDQKNINKIDIKILKNYLRAHSFLTEILDFTIESKNNFIKRN